MLHKKIARMGRLFMALALAIILGAAVSGCESSGIGPSGPEGGGEEGGIDVASIGEQLGFSDGDMLNVENGIEINFSTPLDPSTLFDTGTESAVSEDFRVSILGSDGEEAEILRWQLRNGDTTLFIAAVLRAQSQYLLRLHAGLGNITGEVLGQPVEGLFWTPPNRFSLFGDNASSIAGSFEIYGYAIPGTVFVGDGSMTYMVDILENVLVVGDGLETVGKLVNLNRDGAAAAIVDGVDPKITHFRYAADIKAGFPTRFTDQSELCRAGDASSLSDLNGDGVAELLLTYSCNYPDGSRSYESYLFYGRDFGSDVSLASADFAFSVPGSEQLPPEFGAVAGDVNGDGFNDLVRIAYDEATAKGVVHIYMGGANGLVASSAAKGALPAPSVEITSVGIDDSPLHVKVGDVNGDGIDDIVLVELMITLPVKAEYQFSYKFVVILGRESFESTMDTSESFAVIDCEGQPSCGERRNYFEVADIDGDEIADLLIGAPEYTGAKAPASSYGIAYVIFGGEEIRDDDGRVIDRVSMADRYIFASNAANLGGTVMSMGDMYNDGGSYFAVLGKNVEVGGIVYFIYDGRELKEMGGKVVSDDYVLDSFVLSTNEPKL